MVKRKTYMVSYEYINSSNVTLAVPEPLLTIVTTKTSPISTCTLPSVGVPFIL